MGCFPSRLPSLEQLGVRDIAHHMHLDTMDRLEAQIRAQELQRMVQNIDIDRYQRIIGLAKIVHEQQGGTFCRAYAAAEILAGFQKGVSAQTREQEIREILTG